jgi:hypothetical protein
MVDVTSSPNSEGYRRSLIIAVVKLSSEVLVTNGFTCRTAGPGLTASEANVVTGITIVENSRYATVYWTLLIDFVYKQR